MPKEETIELKHIRNVIGEKEDLPKQNPRASLSSRIHTLLLRTIGVPQLTHLYGALGLNKTLTLATGEDSIVSLFSDGTYLYAGSYTIPGKVVKIDLSTFTAVSTLTLTAGEDSIVSLFSDGTYLYAGSYTIPGKVVKIDLSTFTAVSTLTLTAGEDSIVSLFSDGTYLYAGSYTIPGKIVRRYIIPTSDLHKRKIDVIDEQTHTGVYSLYPTLSDGVLVTSGIGVYVMGAYVEIVPAGTIKTAFYITSIFINRVSGNAGFEVEVATGAAASESKIATVFVRMDNLARSNECILPIPIKVASNTRISAMMADSTGGLTARIRIHYKT